MIFAFIDRIFTSPPLRRHKQGYVEDTALAYVTSFIREWNGSNPNSKKDDNVFLPRVYRYLLKKLSVAHNSSDEAWYDVIQGDENFKVVVPKSLPEAYQDMVTFLYIQASKSSNSTSDAAGVGGGPQPLAEWRGTKCESMCSFQVNLNVILIQFLCRYSR
jgi:hypothetical protein